MTMYQTKFNSMSKQLPFCFAILPTMTKTKAIVKKALFLLLTHSFIHQTLAESLPCRNAGVTKLEKINHVLKKKSQ